MNTPTPDKLRCALLLGCIVLASASQLQAQRSIRHRVAQPDFLVGAAIEAGELGRGNPLEDPAYTSLLGTHYSMVSPENSLKWTIVHPTRTKYDFGFSDRALAFAQSNGMAVRGHTLCWYAANPPWLIDFAKTASPSEMNRLLKQHIMSVVGRYKGRIFAWDVVNEAVSDWATGTGFGLQDSVWFNEPGIGLSGIGYIEQAFRWAHEADPNALLFYNDYNIEEPGPKFSAVYNLVRELLSRGVPIHGVGFQMHIDTSGYPRSAGLKANIEKLEELGLQVHITEMDVRIPVDSSGRTSPNDVQAQARTYRRILEVCIDSPACTGFQTWGFTDRYSWIPYYFKGYGAALPFDDSLRPKPAMRHMREVLSRLPLVRRRAPARRQR